jgi:Putative metal-binding motif
MKSCRSRNTSLEVTLKRSSVAQYGDVAWLLCLFVTVFSGRAHAHADGEATEGCGCHGGGQTPEVTITPNLTTIGPGQTITLTVSISQTNGPVAGFFIEDSAGVFGIVDSGTKLLGDGVTHTAPRTGSGGFTRFKVGWTAPSHPGGADFRVWANSANGDGTTRGDAEGQAFFSTAFGCSGTKYYHDYDGDTYGSVASGYTVNCSPPQYYTETVGDCDDNDPTVYPGAPEICDGKDNNCNGEIDEGLPILTFCTDADGDGHGVLGEAAVTGCKPPKGFGLCDGDCNDDDPTIYPGAPELCDGKDNNCNGEIDDGARAVCGVGWCARYADSCTASDCTPGPPRAEVCNDFDDDCDGVVDNGSNLQLCGKLGLACREGVCVADPNAADDTTMPSGGLGYASANEPQTAPPSGCALQVGGNRGPFASAGLILVLATLLRAKRRRSFRAARSRGCGRGDATVSCPRAVGCGRFRSARLGTRPPQRL